MQDKLKVETSGILAWLVRGCLEWQKKGLNPPEIVRAATEEYQREEDDLARFVEDCCIRNANTQVRPKELYEAYKSWAVENTNETLSLKAFGQKIKRFVDDDYRDKKGKVYIGLGLLENESKKI